MRTHRTKGLSFRMESPFLRIAVRDFGIYKNGSRSRQRQPFESKTGVSKTAFMLG
jgi:hypothetical protein